MAKLGIWARSTKPGTQYSTHTHFRKWTFKYEVSNNYLSVWHQFSSVAQWCLTLCDPMDCSKPGLPVITNSRSLLKLMSIALVMPSNHLILCHPLLLLPSISPSIRVTSGSQSIAVSASASVLPMNIQDWFPLGWTGWISLQSKGFSRVFSNITVQKHQLFCAQLSL